MLEVRCLHEPNKLLGRVSCSIHPDKAKENATIAFAIPGEILKLKLKKYYAVLDPPPSCRTNVYFALSAEEVPIEKLRLIDNFVEA